MPSKYDSINKIKKENPTLTWTQAAHKAGFSGEWASSKGRAKPRTGNAAGQARRRASFDQPSTELAAYEAKTLKKETSKLSAEAKMFGLEPFQVEHLADQDDIQNLISGSGGDPDNLLKVRQSDARLKDRIKQILTNDYAVTIDPSAESYRVIPKKFFDPIADPSTLPGFNISVNEASELVQKGGTVKFAPNRAQMTALAGAGIAALGPLGTAASAAETAGRTEIARKTGNPLDIIQAGIAGASTVADVVSYAPPLAPVASAVSTAADVTNIGIDTARSIDIGNELKYIGGQVRLGRLPYGLDQVASWAKSAF